MSHVYSFAVVPGDWVLDGDWHDVFVPRDKDVDEEDEFKEGVRELEDEGSVSMNWAFSHCFNEATRGMWQAFLVGGPLSWDSNGRYLVLDARRQDLLRDLKMYTPALGDDEPTYYPLFRELFQLIERVLAKHQGEQVVMVIH